MAITKTSNAQELKTRGQKDMLSQVRPQEKRRHEIDEEELDQLAQANSSNTRNEPQSALTREDAATAALPEINPAVMALPADAAALITTAPTLTGLGTMGSLLGSLALAGIAGAAGGAGSKTTAITKTPIAGLSATSDSGVKADGITNQSKPTLKGTADPGAKLRIELDTNADGMPDVVLETVADNNGNWAVEPQQALPEGPINARVTSGNNPTPALFSFVVDTTITLSAKLATASDTGTLEDSTTADNTPTLSGVGTPGDTIDIVAPTGEKLTTTVRADGTWALTPSQPLPNGAKNFSITSTDPAGNTQKQTLTVTIDTNAPTAPVASLSSQSDSGRLGDNLTSDNTPTIKGTGNPGDTIQVIIGGRVHTTTVTSDDTWTITTATLPDGPHTATITATDPAGNTSQKTSLPILVDTAAPGPLTAALDIASDSGIKGDGRTSDTTPTISGTGEPGASISVVIAGQTLTTTVAPDGTWSVTPSALADGPYAVNITQTDPAGNTATTNANLIVDTAAPNNLTASLDSSSDTGTKNDNLTNDNTPTISGTGEPGALISVLINGQTLSTTVDPNGSWSVTSTTLSDGPYTAAVTQTDAAGNISTTTTALTVDTAQPALNAKLDPASDSGTQGDTLTKDNTPTIGGTGEPGASITVIIGGQTLSTTVAPDGTWSVTPTTLADGPYSAQVTAIDAAGNSSTVNVPLIVDTAQPSLTATLDPSSDSATQGDAITKDNTPTISGTGEPGATISVLIGGQTLAATVAANGTWSVTPTTLADGPYTAAITQTDAAGNTSTTNAPLTVDTTIPGPLTATLDSASDSATQGDTLTKDNTPTISGTGEPGASISVLIGGQTLTATVAPNGNWSVTPTTLADGPYTAAITQTDAAGNTSTASAQVTIDTAPPNPLTASLDSASDSGTQGDAITKDDTPTISGTGEPGASISVLIGGQTLTTIVAANGTWSVTPTTLADGPYTANITQTDAAGNTATATAPVTIDTTAPGPLTAAMDPDSDSGTKGDERTNNPTPTISGTGEPGASISVLIGGQTLTTTVAADGTWSVTPTTLSDGPYTAAVTQTDAAGNTATTNASLVVNTSAPGPLTAMLAPGSDSGTKGDYLTNDSTPTLSGSGEPGASISVLINGQTLTTTVNTNGFWSVTPAVLTDGPYSAAATQTDAAGNTSTTSTNVTVDTQAPTLIAALDPASDSAAQGDNLTRDDTPTISGTGEPGATISVLIDGQTLTTTVLPNGTWSVTPTALTDGPHTAVVNQSDLAGNLSTVNVSINIDTKPPALSASLDTASNSGLPSDAITKDDTPTISGTGEPGATISVVIGGQTLTTTVAPDGAWSVTPTTLADGPYTAAITQTDAAGNTSTASVPVTVDTTAPGPLTATLDSASDSGTPGDARTNDNTPTLSGTGEPGASISVLIGGQTLTTTVAANGTWSVTPAALPDGPYTAAITQTDAAGNTLTASTPVTIDTLATAAPVIVINTDANNDGFINALELSNATTISITVTLPAGSKVGDSLVITDGISTQTIVLTAAMVSLGSVDTIFAKPAEGVAMTVNAELRDAAGNASPSSQDQATLDTTAADAPKINIITDSNNNGVIDNAELSGSLTVSVRIDLPGSAIVGDTLQVVGVDESGNEYIQNFLLTATDIANGAVSTTFPIPHQRENLQVTAHLIDEAGNTSSKGQDNAKLDSILPTDPNIQITADQNNDGLISKAEAESARELTVRIKIAQDGTVREGDKLEVNDSNGRNLPDYAITSDDLRNGYVDMSFGYMPGDNEGIKVYAKLTTAAGPSLATVDIAIMDFTQPSQPDAQIIEDANNDAYINASELQGKIDVLVNLPGDAQIGDTLITKDNAGNEVKITLTSELIAARKVVVQLPAPAEGGTFSVSANIVDLAGNVGDDSPRDSAILDTLAPAAFSAGLAPASDSATKGDTRTYDNTPTISGTGEPGATISVVIGGQTLTTTVAANGMWSVTPTTLADGTYTAAVTQTDVAGNVTNAATDVIIDTAAPGPLTAVLAPGSDSGIQGDAITKDNTPTISGTGEPGATISVVIGGQTLTTTVAPDGTWSVTPTTLADGPYTAAITQTDAAGNTSTASVPVTVDTTAPGPLTATLGSASDSGTPGDALTNDNTPTLSGTGEPGASISVLIGGQTLTTTVAANGTWSVTPAALPDGPYTAAITQTDAAGNTLTASTPVTIDTLATAAPVIVINTDANNDGFINALELSNATTISITVTLPAGSKVGDSLVITDGISTQTIVLTAAMVSLGSVDTTFARPAEGASLAVSAQLRDAAGNASPSSQDQALLDTTASAAPTVSITTDTDNDGFLNATEVGTASVATVKIGLPLTAVAGDVMTVTDNAGNSRSFVLTAADIAATNLTTSFPLPAEGVNLKVSAALTDLAGNVSAPGTDNAIKDMFATGAPTVTIADDANNDGYINLAEASTNTNVAVKIGLPTGAAGAAKAGDTLTVTDNQGHTVTITLSAADIANGYVDTRVPMPAHGTPLTVTAFIKDAANNTSPSAFDTATIDKSAPLAPSIAIREDANNNGYISAAELSGQIDVRVTLPSGSQVGDTLIVKDNQGNTISITLTAAHISAGLVDASVPTPAEGFALSVTAQLTDISGNPGAVSAADTAVLDTVAPGPLTGSLDSSSDSGVQGDTRTKDNTPTISGRGEPGATISVLIGGQTLTTTVAADGTWSVTPNTLLDGNYSASITQTDAAGNTSTASAPVIVDTTPPVLTARLDAGSDFGASNSDARTNDFTPTISGTGEAGASIQVVIAGQTLTTTVAANGTWSVTPTAMLDGNYTASVTETDSAGNSASAVANVTIDTKPPGDVSLAPIPEDIKSVIDLSTIDASGTVVSTITSVTFNSLPSGGTLYRADGTTPITLGQTITGTELASLKVQSTLHSSFSIAFNITAVDAAGNSGILTVTQPVRAIADADPITIAPVAPELLAGTSTGLVENQFAQSLDLDVLAPGSSANGFAQRTRVSVIGGAMDTTSVTFTPIDRNTLSVAAHSGTYMSKFTGLIYLTAGTYTANTNGVNVDETVRLDLGGITMLTVENWGATPATASLVVSQAGFYTLDTYFMNFSGPGGLPALNLSKNGGANVAINTTNFTLFRTVAEAEAAVMAAGASGLSDLQGSRDGMNGYYTTNREGRGAAGDLIKLQSVSLTTVDTDGSESNSIVISNIPVGMTLVSGPNSFTASTGNTYVNVTNWNLTTLSIQTGSDDAAGNFNLVLTSTSTEAVGGDTATATANLPFTVELNTRTFSGTNGDNTGTQSIVGANGGNRMFGGGGADDMVGGRGNDMMYGGSAGIVRNGGFEYWNLNSNLITAGGGFTYQHVNASTINAATGDGPLGGWISGGALRQGTGAQNVTELISTTYLGINNITGSGRFAVDLSANETSGDDLHLRQAITTLPGQTYTLNITMADYRNNVDVFEVLWGDVVIARIASDASRTITMYHGYTAPVVTAVLNASGGATNFVNYAFTVKGSNDAATTNLAIQADITTNSNGRELLGVSLVSTSVDGNDRLEGGRGSDILFGQAGNDTLTGGVAGTPATDAGSVDIGVFSFANNNGNDTFTDFEVGVDRLYLVDVNDSFQGSGNWAATGDATHRSRYPGNPSSSDTNATASSDNNLTLRDFTYANDDGTTTAATGQRHQYITVNANASGDLVINFNTNGGTVGGTNTNMGSVTLTGVKYGSGAGQYDTVAELFGGNGATRLLWATTDGFKDPVTTTTFNGTQVQDFDWTRLTNIQGAAII